MIELLIGFVVGFLLGIYVGSKTARDKVNSWLQER